MEVDEVPKANADEINNETCIELLHSSNCSVETSEQIQPSHTPVDETPADMATENNTKEIHNSEGVAPFSRMNFLTYTPSASTSKSLSNNASTDTKKEIPEFIRILRPHLPRKSKSKAYKRIQNIAKGTVFKSSFQQRIRKKRPKKRLVPKRKTRQLKKLTKSLSIMPRNGLSLCSSSESCRSNETCCHCSCSCSRIARF